MQQDNPSVSVAILAFNERESIESVVDGLAAQLRGRDYEIIIVDDGSTDGMSELADRLAAADASRIRVVRHETNLGGGATTRTGLFSARKDLVMVVPGDGQFRAEDIPRFLAAIGNADVVASRRMNRSGGRLRAFNSMIYRAVVRAILGLSSKDINWVKLYRRERVQSLNLIANSWLIDTEILYRARQFKWRVAEIEVPELPRHGGTPTGSNPLHMLAVALELWRFKRALNRVQNPGAARPIEVRPPVRAL